MQVEDQLVAVGTLQDQFALMVHDRVVELEAEVQKLRASPVDPRVRLLGTRTQSDSGAVFVRVLTKKPLDPKAWAPRVLARIGGSVRLDLWSCQHFGLTDAFVTECLVQRSDCRPLSIVAVAHAALDTAMGDVTGAAGEPGTVEACGVTCVQWLAESIRTAATSSGGATMFTWDPSTASTVSHDISDLDESGCRTVPELAVWSMLNGWMASQLEHTELWHPRGISSSRMATDLVRTLAAHLSQNGL